jgi:hypothetical protein
MFTVILSYAVPGGASALQLVIAHLQDLAGLCDGYIARNPKGLEYTLLFEMWVITTHCKVQLRKAQHARGAAKQI